VSPTDTTPGPFQFSPRSNRAHDIPWIEWSGDVFARARSANRPVLLSIAASWCPRCHVMDETTYSDPAVYDLIAAGFVPVRVDADARPDVAQRYGSGALPTTAILTAGGDVLAESSYLPPEPMLAMLRGEYPPAERGAEPDREPRAGELWPDMLDTALSILDERSDSEYGGFAEPPGFAPKAPQVSAIRLLIYASGRRGAHDALERATEAARATFGGPIFDHVAGGLFAGSTARDWSAPSHQKLAVDQGALLLALGELALASEDPVDEVRPIVEQTVEYVERILLDPRGAFRMSQDADDAYYALPADWRESRSGPRVDERLFTVANASLGRGLLACGVAYDRTDWLERGRSAVDFLVTELRAGEAGMYRYWDGGRRVLGLLEDQVEAGLAFLHAYEVTGASVYLEQATAVARALERDWHEPGKGFWDVAGTHERLGRLDDRRRPIVQNAHAAEFFLWLGRLTHDDRHLGTARLTLSAHAGSFERAGLDAAGYARVVDRLLSAEPEVKVVGALTEAGEPDRASNELHAAALRLPPPRTVQRLDIDRDATLIEQLGLPAGRSGVAYVCAGPASSAAIESPDDLEGAMQDLVGTPLL
jgi:uncharacterized protein YyaL (SSP411 family)